jgi:hypothetical protein
MRFICATIICLHFATLAYSQDTLYRTNGKTVPVKLIKVDGANIRYKQVGDTSSLIYSINKAYVTKIVHRDGQTENFVQSSVQSPITVNSSLDLKADALPNRVTLNIFDLFFSQVTVDYERMFSSGNFSIKIPLTVGFQSGSPSNRFPNNEYKQRLFRTGCGVYFYPGISDSIRYNVGAAFEFGKNRDSEEYGSTYENIWVYSFLIYNGINFRLSKHWFFSLNIGLGLGSQHYTNSYGNYEYKSNEFIYDYKGGINIGFKF